jgi:hypothetical protein
LARPALPASLQANPDFSAAAADPFRRPQKTCQGGVANIFFNSLFFSGLENARFCRLILFDPYPSGEGS